MTAATMLNAAVWVAGGGLLFGGLDAAAVTSGRIVAASALTAGGYVTAVFRPVSHRWSSVASLFLLCSMFQYGLSSALAGICAMSLIDLLSTANRTLSPGSAAYLLASRVIAASAAWPFVHWWAGGTGGVEPVALAAASLVFFACSALLASLHGSLHGASRFSAVLIHWLTASWPYYAVGTILAGLLPLARWRPQPEGWLVLAPVVYFVHFLDGVWLRPEKSDVESAASASGLSRLAKAYLTAIVAGGLGLLAASLVLWPLSFTGPLGAYLAAAAVCSTCKVRFPRMEGSVSLGLLPVLICSIELGITASLVVAAASVSVQSYWKPVSRPVPIQVLFNSCCLVLSAGFTFAMAQVLQAFVPEPSVALRLAWSTTVLYLTNTFLVAVMMAVAEGRRDLLAVWRGCYFWAFPYYLVGAAGAGLIIHAGRQLGWQTSMLFVPSVLALGLSYRFRMREAG